MRRERCLRQTKGRVRAEKVRDEQVHKRQVLEKWCTEQRLRAAKGHKQAQLNTPLRAQAARGRISVACGNGSAPGPIELGLHVMVCDVYWVSCVRGSAT